MAAWEEGECGRVGVGRWTKNKDFQFKRLGLKSALSKWANERRAGKGRQRAHAQHPRVPHMSMNERGDRDPPPLVTDQTSTPTMPSLCLTWKLVFSKQTKNPRCSRHA